jgi:hypothetical protein
MPIAFITIDNIDKEEPAYIHFADKSQKKWNCTKPELFRDEYGAMAWGPGTRLKIDYNEAPVKTPAKFGAKYINNARKAQPDEPNTFPDKEPYQGGQSYSSAASGGFSKGATVKDDSARTHDIHKQVAAKCAMDYFVASGATVTDLDASFKTVADIVLNYIEEAPKSSDTGGTDAGSDFQDEFTPDF